VPVIIFDANEGLDWNGIESLRESFKRMTSAYSIGRDFTSISLLSRAAFKSVDLADDFRTTTRWL
jgi:hypothetical protein